MDELEPYAPRFAKMEINKQTAVIYITHIGPMKLWERQSIVFR